MFDFISKKGMTGGNAQIRMTKNAATMQFSMEDAKKEFTAMSAKVSRSFRKAVLKAIRSGTSGTVGSRSSI